MTKKTLFPFLLMVAGITGLGFIAPWWAAAIWILMVATLSRLNTRQNILCGGFALAIVWIIMARYMSSQDEAGIIVKTGTLLGGLSHQMMMVATMVIALITGILSGWLGSALGKAITKKTIEAG